MQISHTVYRDRNNEIDLQLTSNDDPLPAPDGVAMVELTINGAVVGNSDDEFIDYDTSDGTLSLRLGRVPLIMALPDGVYPVEVTAYNASDDNADGIAFGNFMIYLRNWGEANGS